MARHILPVLLAILLAGGYLAAPAFAAPSPQGNQGAVLEQTPDWLSSESASRLDVGIPVLAPSYVPGPFGGEPEISAYDGYYSLYWLIPGAPPTYLHVTGEYGGVIPDFSYYDRNVPLVQNATVQGYPAWQDLTPIYDLVYFQIGDVVYTVDSHNLSADDSLSLANSLVEVTIPDTEPPPGTGGPPDLKIGAPSTAKSGEVVSVGIEGTGQAILSTDWGYFLATEDYSVLVDGGTAVDWQVPYVNADTVVDLTLSDVNSGEVLETATVSVQGERSEGEVVEATLSCTSAITAGRTGRLLLTGNGTVAVYATEGVFPVESPNTDFSLYVDGSGYISGEIPVTGAALSLLAPEYETTIFIEVTDPDGALLGDCAIEVVAEDVSGDLNPEDLSGAIAANPGFTGDGSGIDGDHSAAVARVLANPIGFAGDGSGGVEANAADYGGPQPAIALNDGKTAGSPAVAITATDSTTAADNPVAALGQATGPNGMVAQVMGSKGGSLNCPPGGTLAIPAGAVSDQTTVAMQPVPDTALSSPAGIRLLSSAAYDVTVAGPDGKAVEKFDVPVSLTITVEPSDWEEGARIYRIDGNTVDELDTILSEQGTFTAETTTYARFVVGVPASGGVTGSIGVGRILIATLLGVIGMALAFLLFRLLKHRKHGHLATSRPAPTRIRYR